MAAAHTRNRSYLFHQKEMLEDQVRMQAYHNAVFHNKSCFEGKVRTLLSAPGHLHARLTRAHLSRWCWTWAPAAAF